jgi:hypothetical protein
MDAQGAKVLEGASEEYRDRFSQWAEAQIKKHAIVVASGVYISSEYMGKLSRGEFARELSANMVRMLAAYRGETFDETTAWLQGRSLDADQAQPITRAQINAIDKVEDCYDRIGWLLARARELSMREERPTTIEALRQWLLENLDLAVERSGLSEERIRAIGDGEKIEVGDVASIGLIWSGDATWLEQLVNPKPQQVKTPKSQAKRS